MRIQPPYRKGENTLKPFLGNELERGIIFDIQLQFQSPEGTHIFLVYGDVPLGWVGFWREIPQQGYGFVLENP